MGIKNDSCCYYHNSNWSNCFCNQNDVRRDTMNKFWKAALIRALRTVAQNLASTLPTTLIITPAMVEKADWKVVYIVLAWLLTGLLGGVASLLTSIATGLPEAKEE